MSTPSADVYTGTAYPAGDGARRRSEDHRRSRPRNSGGTGRPRATRASGVSSSRPSGSRPGSGTSGRSSQSRRRETDARRRSGRGRRTQPESPVVQFAGGLIGWGAQRLEAALTFYNKANLAMKGLIWALFISALGMLFLYGPVGDLYRANRAQEELSAQLAVLNETNEELQDKIDLLNTDQGIIDEARLHGYVPAGETAVEVRGLDVDEGHQPGEAVAAPDTYGYVEPMPRTWYTVLLDTFFGYQPLA